MCQTGEYAERGIWGLVGYQTEFAVDKEQYVVEVPANSELAKLGLKAQDAILNCDGKDVDTVNDLRKACQAAGANGKLKIEIFRSQKRLAVTVPAGKMEKAK